MGLCCLGVGVKGGFSRKVGGRGRRLSCEGIDFGGTRMNQNKKY